MKSAFRIFLSVAATMLCGVFLASQLSAQDPAWHQVPKDDLMGNRGEIAKTLLTTANDKVCIQILQRPETDNDVLYLKMLACKRLGTFGTKDAVAQLVSMLDKEHEGFYARYALETIPGAEVDAAVCEAVKNLKQSTALAGALTTLGVRAGYFGPGATSAATAKEFLKNEDAEVRKAAAYAFACCGGDAAVEFFTQASIDPEQADSAFLLGEIFLAKGEKEKAVKIFDALAAANIKPYQKEAAVYHGVLARGNDGIELLVAQLNAESPELFEVGLKAGRELPTGAAVTKAMIEQLDKQKDAYRKALLVRSIGDRKDKESKAVSLSVISESAKSGDAVVRVAAIDSLNNIGDASVLPILIAAANEKSSDGVSAAAQNTLANLPGKEVDGAIVGLLEKGDTAAKVAAIDLIEQRRIISAFPLLKEALKNDNAAVRKAALDALGQVATIDDLPMLLGFLSEAKTDDDVAAVQHVLKSACTRMSQDAAAGEVAKLFASASMPQKLFLIDLLKEIGGAKAMEEVEKCVWGQDAELKDKATEALGSWRSPKDIDLVATACLKLARESTENKYKIRGLRGYVRLARQFNMSEERRIKICDEVFALADRNDDKILIFDVYGRNPSLKMLALAMKHVDNDVFKEKACEAIVQIGEKLQGKSPETAAAMKKVIETSGNNALKDKAKIVLDRQ